MLRQIVLSLHRNKVLLSLIHMDLQQVSYNSKEVN
jgi:hypothetical protein